MSESKKIVIIGGVAAGAKTAAKARRENPNADITIYTDEAYISYAGCGEPYYIGDEIKKREQLLARSVDDFLTDYDVIVKTEHRVTKINRNEKTIIVKNLIENTDFEVPYDVLVIGTGASPIVPPLPGLDLPGVYNLRTIPDTDAIRAKVDSGAKKAVIIGAGYIGLEVAENLRHRGLEVTLVEMADQVAPPYDVDVAAHIKNVLEQNGIKVMLKSPLQEILGTKESGVTGVMVNDHEIPTEMVVVSIGVRPNVKLAVSAGIEIGTTGAIKVDEHLRTNDPNIYAAGDCIEVTNLITGKPTWIPLGDYANLQGRVLGQNVNGGKATFRGVLGTSIFRVFDLAVAGTGINEKNATKEGIDYEAVVVPASDKPGYMPEAKNVNVKLLADKVTQKVIGAQIWGQGSVDKAIDTIATAIHFNAKVSDLMQLDLAYAPPFAPALGLPIVAANVLQNKLDKQTEGELPQKVYERAQNKEDFIFLDVRKAEELKQVCLPTCTNIPVQELNQRCEELDRNKEIITSCGVGLRAARAYRILKNKGFKNVKYMDGGIKAWPYPEKGTAE